MGKTITLPSTDTTANAGAGGNQDLNRQRPTEWKPNGAECKQSTPPRFYLSERRLEVLSLAACGLNDRQIGEQVGIAAQTVRHHLQAVQTKLHVHNATRATVLKGNALLASSQWRILPTLRHHN